MHIEGNPDLWLYLKREKENREFINMFRNKVAFEQNPPKKRKKNRWVVRFIIDRILKP